MKIPSKRKVAELESRYIEKDEPVLGDVVEALRARWRNGAKDPFTALHLVFLGWYLQVEPPMLTGGTIEPETACEFVEAYEYLTEVVIPSSRLVSLFSKMKDVAPWALETIVDGEPGLGEDTGELELEEEDWAPIVQFYLNESWDLPGGA